MPHDAEVVRDEEHGEVELAAQAQEQVDDLRLDRNVERGDRLVADEEVRLHGERAGDGDALALPAGELVRIAADDSPDRARPFRASAWRLCRPPVGSTSPCASGPSSDGLADAHARVERGEGVLEHGLDPRRAACGRAAIDRRRRRDARDPALGSRMPAITRPRVDLPQPGLADEAERLAARDRERDLAHRLHGALLDSAAEPGGDTVAERQVRSEALRDPVDRRGRLRSRRFRRGEDERMVAARLAQNVAGRLRHDEAGGARARAARAERAALGRARGATASSPGSGAGRARAPPATAASRGGRGCRDGAAQRAPAPSAPPRRSGRRT